MPFLPPDGPLYRPARPAPAPKPAIAPGTLLQLGKPMPSPAPMPDVNLDLQLKDLDLQLDDLNWRIEKDLNFQWEKMDAQAQRAAEKARNFQWDKMDSDLSRANDAMLLAQAAAARAGWRTTSDDHSYESGQNDLENHRYDQALEAFNQVAARAGARADAGWYWKAFTLNKLGRRDEAIAAIAELRKTYPNSRWLDDAKALELEVKQQAGKPVSPEGESDEELKLMAVNGLMQSDPDRAVPLIEKLLKSSQSPRFKQRALYVLAVSSSARAQQVLEQIARGGGNPDLQVKAITYIGTLKRRQQGNGNQTTPAILPEIYASSNDVPVKRAILAVYMQNRDTQHLAEVARSEKNADLRQDAFRQLGNIDGQPELWQVYQSETSPDVKEQILGCMWNNGNAQKLAEVARTEKDPKLRRAALRVLASQRNSPNLGDTLVSIYNAEQDPQNKRSIVDMLHSERNAKALVEIAKNEKDTKTKLHVVDLLSNMKSKEAQDYLMEILTK